MDNHNQHSSDSQRQPATASDSQRQPATATEGNAEMPKYPFTYSTVLLTLNARLYAG